MLNTDIIANFIGLRNIAIDKIREKKILLSFTSQHRNQSKFALVAVRKHPESTITENRPLNILFSEVTSFCSF